MGITWKRVLFVASAAFVAGLVVLLALFAASRILTLWDDGDSAVNYGDVPALAHESYRVELGKCLEHHITYADRLSAGSTQGVSRFAIARCADLSASWDGSRLIGGHEWDDPTAADLKACRKAAETYFRENHPGAAPSVYVKAKWFYIRSVCIPTKGTAGTW